MSAQIVSLVTPERVDKAWAEYVEYAREVIDDPRVLTDRKFYQEFTRRHERWKRLFMAMEQSS